jgi:hypothetical protein
LIVNTPFLREAKSMIDPLKKGYPQFIFKVFDMFTDGRL